MRVLKIEHKIKLIFNSLEITIEIGFIELFVVTYFVTKLFDLLY